MSHITIGIMNNESYYMTHKVEYSRNPKNSRKESFLTSRANIWRSRGMIFIFFKMVHFKLFSKKYFFKITYFGQF